MGLLICRTRQKDSSYNLNEKKWFNGQSHKTCGKYGETTAESEWCRLGENDSNVFKVSHVWIATLNIAGVEQDRNERCVWRISVGSFKCIQKCVWKIISHYSSLSQFHKEIVLQLKNQIHFNFISNPSDFLFLSNTKDYISKNINVFIFSCNSNQWALELCNIKRHHKSSIISRCTQQGWTRNKFEITVFNVDKQDTAGKGQGKADTNRNTGE